MTLWLITAQQPAPDVDAGVGIGLFLIWLIFLVAAFVLFIWALIDAIKNPRLSDTERIIWILVIIFVGCLGPILYLLIGRKSGGPTRPPGGAGM